MLSGAHQSVIFLLCHLAEQEFLMQRNCLRQCDDQQNCFSGNTVDISCQVFRFVEDHGRQLRDFISKGERNLLDQVPQLWPDGFAGLISPYAPFYP